MRYIFTMILNLLGFLTAPVIFPIAYLLRDISIVRSKLLWIYYDDEDEFGFDVEWFMVGRERNFFTAYKWCAIRNPAWNLQALSMLKGSTMSYVFTEVRGILQRDGKVIEPALNTSAVLKYVDERGVYMDNKGEYLSLKHSLIGSQFCRFYNINTGRKYWRYSFANKVLDNLWIELQVGYTTRASVRLKFKIIKKIV